MIEELRVASRALESALEHYFDLCFAACAQHKVASVAGDISDMILREFQTVVSFEVRLEYSKRLIGRLRNHSRKIVPINSLPPELLARIFQLAIQPEDTLQSPVKASFRPQTKPPISLLQVCSYWRSTALRSHHLWTHIDIAPLTTNEKWAVSRANLFASCSNGLPLTLNIRLGPNGSSRCEDFTLDLCASTATRAKEITISSTHKICSAHSSIINKIFFNSTPGILVQLNLSFTKAARVPLFLVAEDSVGSPAGSLAIDSWAIAVPHQYLEDVFRHVSILRAEGVYPYWTSQAYAGLVKLYLTDMLGESVTLSALAQVLAASPQLRSFHFGVALAEEEGDGGLSPVHLDQLESLYLEFNDSEQHERVLSLIQPGPMPLRVSAIFTDDETPPLTHGYYKQFFERANVVQFHAAVQLPNQPLEMPKLLDLLPNSHTLSLNGFDIPHGYDLPLLAKDMPTEMHLTSLLLANCAIELSGFKILAKLYPTASFTIDPDSCTVVDGGDEEDVGMHEDELVAICPIVRFAKCDDPNEADWN